MCADVREILFAASVTCSQNAVLRCVGDAQLCTPSISYGPVFLLQMVVTANIQHQRCCSERAEQSISLEHLSCEERLRELGLFLAWRREGSGPFLHCGLPVFEGSIFEGRENDCL